MKRYPTTLPLEHVLAQIVQFCVDDFSLDPDVGIDEQWNVAYICACFIAQHTVEGEQGVEKETAHHRMQMHRAMPYDERVELAKAFIAEFGGLLATIVETDNEAHEKPGGGERLASIRRYALKAVGNLAHWRVVSQETPGGTWCKFSDVWAAYFTPTPQEAATVRGDAELLEDVAEALANYSLSQKHGDPVGHRLTMNLRERFRAYRNAIPPTDKE